MLRRAALVLVAATALALGATGVASAHPLGNFTVNHHAEVVLSGDRAYVRYVLDLAEIPTFQARNRVAARGSDGYAADLRETVVEGLALDVDGDRRALRPLRHRLTFPGGAAGLSTTRFELVLDGGAATPGEEHAVAIRDDVLAGRLGWREIVIRAERGARLTTSTVPAASVSDRLRSYPRDLLSSPLEVRSASARYLAGVDANAPPLDGTSGEAPVRGAPAADGFATVVDDELGVGVVLVALLVSMFWGAAHALTPGHGKAIVAAYLVGTRGRPRDALALGLVVTVTHTIGVFALGFVTLALSSVVVPEDLYPWLELVSALLVVLVGVAVFRRRVVAALGHPHAHEDAYDHHHQMSDEEHARAHGRPRGSGVRGLLAVGISGGLLPCPTALVVLLAAIALHRVAFGLALIVAFSVGLAAVISGIGLLAILARRQFGRMSLDGPVVSALPTVSALVILVVGVAMTARALPGVV